MQRKMAEFGLDGMGGFPDSIGFRSRVGCRIYSIRTVKAISRREGQECSHLVRGNSGFLAGQVIGDLSIRTDKAISAGDAVDGPSGHLMHGANPVLMISG
jgi:hypothetical protein